MKDFNQKQNELQEEVIDLVDSLKFDNPKDTEQAKGLIAKTFDAVDGALDDIICINYKLNDLVDKWLPHKREKRELNEKEGRLLSLIDKTIKMFNSFPEKEKEQIKSKEIIEIINKKVALTNDFIDDFWDEALKQEMAKEVSDPFWRTTKRI